MTDTNLAVSQPGSSRPHRDPAAPAAPTPPLAPSAPRAARAARRAGCDRTRRRLHVRPRPARQRAQLPALRGERAGPRAARRAAVAAGGALRPRGAGAHAGGKPRPRLPGVFREQRLRARRPAPAPAPRPGALGTGRGRTPARSHPHLVPGSQHPRPRSLPRAHRLPAPTTSARPRCSPSRSHSSAGARRRCSRSAPRVDCARARGWRFLAYDFRAWQRGRRAASLVALPWEELLPLRLDTVRRLAGVERPEEAHPEGILRGRVVARAAQ